MRALRGIACAVWCLWAATASAHIVVGARTLQQWVAEADLVLRARVVESGSRLGLSTERGAASRPVVEVQVLEVIKGALDAPTVRFAQHGHGVATFSAGEESLVFLIDSARSRELRALHEADVIDWVSLQEHDEGFPLRPATREALLAAVRAYAGAEGAAAEVRLAALREATLGLLGSGDPDLAASAIRDLVLAPELPLLVSADVSALRPVLEDPEASIGMRAALLIELERRGLLDGTALWMRWLSDATPSATRVAALRASGSAARPAVRRRVLALVADPDPEVAAAAARAAGGVGDEAAVASLTRALARPEASVRHAAVRALGAIASAPARHALQAAADAHADEATRRRARAELRKREADARP